jgi:hypothetical protein
MNVKQNSRLRPTVNHRSEALTPYKGPSMVGALGLWGSSVSGGDDIDIPCGRPGTDTL